MISEPPTSPVKRKLSLDPGLAVVIAAVITFGGGVGGAWIGRATAAGPHAVGSRSRSTSSPTATPSLAANSIVIQDPRSGAKVKQCPQISGTGKIPVGYGLWIIVVPDTSQQSRQYWIESSASADGPDHWSATSSISIGSPNTSKTNAYIYAVLINRQWSGYLAHSTVEGSFWAKSLPPNIAVAGPVNVTRVAGTGTCH